MKTGGKVGFEIQDDVYVENTNGITKLFHPKHTVSTNIVGNLVNLTTLDLNFGKL